MAMRNTVPVMGAVSLIGLLGLSPVQAQSVGLDASAVYTPSQAARGKDLYDANCLSCHGAAAAGGQFAPALKGTGFQANWGGQSAGALHAYIQETMPPGGGGSLSVAAYSAITAYLLQANGVAAGAAEFAPAERAAATGRPPVSPAPAVEPAREGFARPQPNLDAVYEREMAQRRALLEGLRPVTDEMLKSPDDGSWLMWRRAYDGLGFSPLGQVNVRNVARLGVAWSYLLHQSVNEITPLVHDRVLFVHSGDAVQAFDAVSGDLLWQHVRPMADGLNNGRGSRTKGMAIYQNMLFAPMPDGHVIALDARTGAMVWEHQVLTPQEVASGVRLSGVPIVAKGKVIMGTALSITVKGGCYIFALDAATGRESWRFNTIAQPGEPGGDSWRDLPADQRFGGAQWTGGSYDPELDLLYFGVGNTYNTQSLLTPVEEPNSSNAGLFTESTVAIDPDTGKLAWHYQHMPRDVWDQDWAFEQSLIDMPVNGARRKLVVTAGKMALFDAVDRTDGAYVFSRDVGLQNIVVGVDPRTGAKTYNPALAPSPGETKLICPGASGHRNWQSTAYNPRTHIMYVPILEACGDFTWTPRTAAEVAMGGNDQRFQTRPMPESDGNFGRIQAINLRTGKTEWTVRQRAPMSSSILTTGGGLAFAASGDRYFRAYNQANGKVLWQMRLPTTASASPITYSVDGIQYVAIVAGGGNPQDTGWAMLAPEIVNATGPTTLWVFRLR